MILVSGATGCSPQFSLANGFLALAVATLTLDVAAS